MLVQKAIRSGDQGVRRIGYAAIAERQSPEAAYALARNDPNARVQTWAQTLIKESDQEGEQRAASTRAGASEATLF